MLSELVIFILPKVTSALRAAIVPVFWSAPYLAKNAMLGSLIVWRVSATALVMLYSDKLVSVGRVPLRMSVVKGFFVAQQVMGLTAARLAILRRLAPRVLSVGIGKGLRPMEVLVWPWS